MACHVSNLRYHSYISYLSYKHQITIQATHPKVVGDDDAVRKPHEERSDSWGESLPKKSVLEEDVLSHQGPPTK